MQGVKGAKVYDSSLNGVEDRKTLLHYNTMKAIMAALTGKHNAVIENRDEPFRA